jgi:chromosomal replication initiation ATPase DnaA
METLTEIRECIRDANRVNETNMMLRMLTASQKYNLIQYMVTPWINSKHIDFEPDTDCVLLETDKAKLIKDIVYRYYKLTMDLTTRRREQVLARQVAIYFIRRHTRLTTSQIGGLFRKDHATVLHSLKAINDMLDWDKEFIHDFDAIDRRIHF